MPAYNEEKTIAATIECFRELKLPYDLIVVNDGSRDRTAEILAELGVTSITLPYNLGLGGAMQTGYRYARRHGYDIAIQLDADGQHDPKDLPRLVEAVQQTGAGLVIGSRFVAPTGYHAPLDRRLAMIFFSQLISLIVGYRLTDTTSGYQAINRQVIELFAEWYPSDFAEVEGMVYLHRRGIRIHEIPVRMYERQGGVSSISAIRGLFLSIKATLAVLISLLQGGARR